MANPNIVQVTSILGNNFLGNITSSETMVEIVNNPASSGKVYKVNSLIVTNYENGNIYSCTVNIYDNDDLGGNAFTLVSDLDIPKKSAVAVIDKTTSLYLKEDQSLGVSANAANGLSVTASWEEISQ